jgi:hypothetical protein
MPLEGLQLGKYGLVRLIGSGGMGDVYIGEDARLSRQLAIKVMRAEVLPYPDEDAVKEAARLFQREMKAIARLDHPHILPLYDYGEELLHQTTLIYMVMPFRPEGSLADWFRQRNTPEPLPLQDIASLVSQATEALQYAHDHQIIHQDVKLSNFLIRRKKDVSSPPDLQLADFGIAKISSATSNVSHASRGTPISMAPEQWNGDPVPATDQYALAIMTYELLTGRPPFRGRPEQMMYQHLTVAPPPPSIFRKDVPASIDAVLLHALAKKPQERFPSISAFAVAFQQAMQSTGDLYATLAISEGEAATGTTRELTLPGGRKAQVSIPQGVHDKQVLRLEGLGEPCYAGGPLGVLVLTLAISSQDKTALAREAVYDETVASSSFPNAISKAVLTNGSSHSGGTTETIDEPAPPTSEVSAVNVDPQLAQQSKPGITTGEQPPASLPPTQYALPPAIAPTQLAKDSSGPAARAPVPSSPPIFQDKPVTQPASERQAPPKRPDEKVNIWKIGKRQVVAGLIGFAIVVCLSIATGLPPLQSPGWFIVGLILLVLVAVTPEFFGAVFGPWVGLFTGVGPLVGSIFGSTLVSIRPILLGIILVGFISGFAIHKKEGRYNIRRTLVFSSLGVVVGMIFAIFVFFLQYGATAYFVDAYLIPSSFIALAYVLVGLLLLPILLVIYNRIANRGKSTSTTP